MKICPNSPMPTLDSLMRAFAPALTFPPKLPKLPSLSAFLPALPSPLFPSLNMPNLELVMISIEMQMLQLQQTILGIVKPILSKLGIDLSSFLPKIPGLPDFNLMDLIEGAPDKLIAALKAAMGSIGLNLPGIPSPFFPSLKIPDLEVLMTLKVITAEYMAMVVAKIPDIIGQVTKLLKIPGMPTIPTIPSMAEILAKVKLAIPIPNLPNIDIGAILSSITFPGLPALPKLPSPLIPSFNMPDIEVMLGVISLSVNYVLGPLKPIMDFVMASLAKFLTFSFPLFCITIPDMDLPDVDLPTIPGDPSIPVIV